MAEAKPEINKASPTADHPVDKPTPTDNTGDEEEDKNGGKAEKEEDANEKGNLISPESIMMFIIAGFFDLVGLIPIVNIISDIIAAIIICLWMLITKRNGWGKFVLAFILGLFPVVSDITPIISLIGITFNIKLSASWVGCIFSIIMGGTGTKTIPKAVPGATDGK